MKKYDTEIEEYMQTHFSVLNEKDQRHYSAIEALKLPYGGINYISDLFGISTKTISAGIKEVKKNSIIKKRDKK